MHNFRSNPDDPTPGDEVVLLNIDGTERYRTEVRSLESVDYDQGMYEILTITGHMVVVAACKEEDAWVQVLDQ